ncbi:MAG: hypothetical protein A2X46_17050 [Lentisphaerae bacterium GWF2_57_35]|nr:MAG: hypothetical protein A2X46_17050 [Lentisphaerae bacterium GWF2_57_35]
MKRYPFMQKTMLLQSLALGLCLSVWAQVPQQLNYQGKLVNGTNLVTRNVDMIIGLYAAPSGGLPLFLDSNRVSVVDGFYSTVIGDNPITGTLTNALASGTSYIEVMIDNQVLSPREKLNAAAYALNALSSAGTEWDLTGNSGTVPSVNFLGTKDNQPILMRVNNQRVARLEPGSGPNAIFGYQENTVTVGAVCATIGGGGLSTAAQQVTDRGGTISGGAGNRAGNAAGSTEDASYAAIGGGFRNEAGSGYSTVAGGQGNLVGGTAEGGVIGGGNSNTVSGWNATLVGGIKNTAAGSSSFIGGGGWNQAAGNSSVIAGGWQNVVDASSPNAIVGGGYNNQSIASESSLVDGGTDNSVQQAQYSVVGGGHRNSIIVPAPARLYATISGGVSNQILAFLSTPRGATIPGGIENQAVGIASFAAGCKAQAVHDYSFVWSDMAGPCSSTASNSFVARASGGFVFYTAPGVMIGAQLAAGAGAWNTLSDRASKKNFASVDPQEVLEKLSQIPVMTWSWLPEDEASRHMGPVAQDFRSAFGLGSDERHINTADADGVALAAIQGLYQVVKEKDAKIQELEARLSALEAAVRNGSSARSGF